jgi:WD40 repeat protein
LEDLTHFFALSPDGRMLAAHRANGVQVELWDLAKRRSLGILDIAGNADRTEPLSFSVDGRLLAVAVALGNSVQIWNVASRQLVKTLPMPPGPPISSIVFAPDGKTLVVCTVDNVVTFWNVATWEEIIREVNYNHSLAYGNSLMHALPIFSENGEWFALLGKIRPDGKSSVALWHGPTLAQIAAERPKADNHSRVADGD